MSQPPFNTDARNLEDEFFAQENKRLLEKMRNQSERDERREALRAVVPTDDDGFLDQLLQRGIEAETALALTLVPLAVVAWADGGIDDREREAILRAAAERGVKPGTPARELLETWLKRKPGPRLVEYWKQYVGAIRSDFDDSRRETFRERVIGNARAVAEASGGFLGLTSKISAAEQAALADLDQALS